MDELKQIAELHEISISGTSALAGGSINEVLLLETSVGKKVLKLNKAARFPGMFEAEKEGLETLQNTETIDIPEVLGCGKVKDSSYLLLEYKAPGKQKTNFWSIFAEQLADLHKTTAPEFGFQSDNYIGSLPQQNDSSPTATDFYIDMRLKPQLSLASKKGFSFSSVEITLANMASVIPEEPPALIHGDLWSGNYLVNEYGAPCFIDPAVSFASREMDLAMMKLFGGFPAHFFARYAEVFPLEPGFDERIPLWQLYYLLVHLNIFGSSYLSGVDKILKDFS